MSANISNERKRFLRLQRDFRDAMRTFLLVRKSHQGIGGPEWGQIARQAREYATALGMRWKAAVEQNQGEQQ